MVSNIDLVKWFFPGEKKERGREEGSNVMKERVREYERRRNEYLFYNVVSYLYEKAKRGENKNYQNLKQLLVEVLENSTSVNDLLYKLEEAERIIRGQIKILELEFPGRRKDSPYTGINLNEPLNELEKELRKGSYYTQKPLYLKELKRSSEEI